MDGRLLAQLLRLGLGLGLVLGLVPCSNFRNAVPNQAKRHKHHIANILHPRPDRLEQFAFHALYAKRLALRRCLLLTH
eukprot:SAG31_NODE_7910_length_1567_cov_2.540191_1_plen_78_part_00